MHEREYYPYEPGRFGLPPLTDDVYTSSAAKIRGGSGREIAYTIQENLLEFTDDEYRMHAEVTGSMLSLDLQTNRPLFGKIPRKHPDFFAKHFIGLALDHFEKNGIPIVRFHGLWKDGSVNHKQFFQSYRVNQSKAASAMNTWSGRTVCEYGFTEIAESDVAFTLNRSIVNVYFTKPTSEVRIYTF